eukprot:jgi/Chlat1/303/Chrsp1S03180
MAAAAAPVVEGAWEAAAATASVFQPGDLLEFRSDGFCHWAVYVGTGSYLLAVHHARELLHLVRAAWVPQDGMEDDGDKKNEEETSVTKDYFEAMRKLQLKPQVHYVGHVTFGSDRKATIGALLGDDSCVIKLEPFDKVRKSFRDVCVKNHQFEPSLHPLPRHTIVKRIISKVGCSPNYRLFSNNCEHLVTWARYDTALCDQVGLLASKLFAAGTGSLLGLTAVSGTALALVAGMGAALIAGGTAAGVRAYVMADTKKTLGLQQRHAYQIVEQEFDLGMAEAAVELVKLHALQQRLDRIASGFEALQGGLPAANAAQIASFASAVQVLQALLHMSGMDTIAHEHHGYVSAMHVAHQLCNYAGSKPLAMDTLYSWVLRLLQHLELYWTQVVGC